MRPLIAMSAIRLSETSTLIGLDTPAGAAEPWTRSYLYIRWMLGIGDMNVAHSLTVRCYTLFQNMKAIHVSDKDR